MSELTCPFCGEEEFDAPGLKSHLLNDCEFFAATIDLPRIFLMNPIQYPDAVGEVLAQRIVCDGCGKPMQTVGQPHDGHWTEGDRFPELCGRGRITDLRELEEVTDAITALKGMVEERDATITRLEKELEAHTLISIPKILQRAERAEAQLAKLTGEATSLLDSIFQTVDPEDGEDICAEAFPNGGPGWVLAWLAKHPTDVATGSLSVTTIGVEGPNPVYTSGAHYHDVEHEHE